MARLLLLTSGTNTALADTMQAIIDLSVVTIGSGTSANRSGRSPILPYSQHRCYWFWWVCRQLV